MKQRGWIGVDLDGTLAHYDKWRGIDHIGDPIEPMVARVEGWLREGKTVKIFTARVAEPDIRVRLAVIARIEAWCKGVFGVVLPITNRKDMAMIELWDDRCRQVVPNTGEVVGENG